MSRKTALIGFAVASGITLAAHVSILTRKIQPLDTEQYARHGRDLRVTPDWRFGFVAGMHGAVLVKVRNSGQTLAGHRDRQDRDLELVMGRELKLIPLKFVLEAFFYLFLLAYLFFLAPLLRAKLLRAAGDRWTRFGADLAPGALFFILAAAPLLVWGYGYGGFTNLVGPGAMSYSGPYYHLEMWLNNSSNSISYRAVISPLMLPPAAVAQLGWEGLRHMPVYGTLMDSEPSTTLPYWLGGALVYGLVALALERVCDAIRKRSAMASASTLP